MGDKGWNGEADHRGLPVTDLKGVVDEWRTKAERLAIILKGREIEIQASKRRIATLTFALEVATVTMASVWDEDFLAVFSDSEIEGMIERTNPKGGDFRVEDIVRDALKG